MVRRAPSHKRIVGGDGTRGKRAIYLCNGTKWSGESSAPRQASIQRSKECFWYLEKRDCAFPSIMMRFAYGTSPEQKTESPAMLRLFLDRRLFCHDLRAGYALHPVKGCCRGRRPRRPLQIRCRGLSLRSRNIPTGNAGSRFGSADFTTISSATTTITAGIGSTSMKTPRSGSWERTHTTDTAYKNRCAEGSPSAHRSVSVISF